MTGQDAYAGSDAVRLLAARGVPIRLAFLDIDSTLTGNPAGADRVRDRLAALGFATVFATSRTEEMLMSSATFHASRRTGELDRPEPHLGRRGQRRFYRSPEAVEPRGILDGEIIAGSSGARIFVRHGDRYVLDAEHGAGEIPPGAWRDEALALVAEINGAGPVARPAAIESEIAYETGRSDVFPPAYRLQLHCANGRDIAEFRRRLARERRGQSGDFARTVRLLGDSHPSKGNYKTYLLPRWASKSRAASRIVAAVRGHLPHACPVDLLFIGDSYPDLDMGLLGAPGCAGTLFLVSGSRLADVLRSPRKSEFAGGSLAAIKRRLDPGEAPGVYRFRAPCSDGTERRVVLGSILFPRAGAVESIERFLDLVLVRSW